MKLTASEKERVLALREKGRSIKSIAEEIGCSVGTVGYPSSRWVDHYVLMPTR
jgi:hypothetical protein